MMTASRLHMSSQTSPHPVPLEIAAEEGHVQTVQRLLEGGANINYQQEVKNREYLTMKYR